jgi:hypothetical protein
LRADYVRYYHNDHTHLGLSEETPGGRVRSRGGVALFPSRDSVACTIGTTELHDRRAEEVAFLWLGAGCRIVRSLLRKNPDVSEHQREQPTTRRDQLSVENVPSPMRFTILANHRSTIFLSRYNPVKRWGENVRCISHRTPPHFATCVRASIYAGAEGVTCVGAVSLLGMREANMGKGRRIPCRLVASTRTGKRLQPTLLV